MESKKYITKCIEVYYSENYKDLETMHELANDYVEKYRRINPKAIIKPVVKTGRIEIIEYILVREKKENIEDDNER